LTDNGELRTLAVEEARSLEHRYVVSNITPDNMELFVREKSIHATVKGALLRVLQQKAVIADLAAKKHDRDGEMAKT